MRVLVISNTPWSCNNSFGNTFTALFKRLSDKGEIELANIYCNRGTPDGSVHGKFFQITEKSIIQNIFNKNNSFGKCVTAQTNPVTKYSNFYNFMRKTRLQLFYWARDLIWMCARRKPSELLDFIDEFNPDLIFMPLYSLFHVNRLGRQIQKITGVPLILYVYDDVYSLKQRSFSPFFWIDRFMKRAAIRKTVKASSKLYTICRQQKEEYSKTFGTECEVLYKPAQAGVLMSGESGCESALVYTGNIGNGRWKVLASIGKACKDFGEGIELRIYTATPITAAMKKAFSKGAVRICGNVPPSEVYFVQRNAAALVLAEPFEGKDVGLTRLSISTKIPDYFASGRPIFAAGSKKIASIQYLIDNNTSFLCTDKQLVYSEAARFIKEIQFYVSNEGSSSEVSEQIRNASACVERDFNAKRTGERLLCDFNEVLRTHLQ